MQLELSYWCPDSLKEACQAFLATQCDGLAEATIGDYIERAKWLQAVLGPYRPIGEITFALLENVARTYGPKGHGLMNVTVKKRLVFLRAVLKYAHARGILAKVPDLPLKILRDDGRRRKNFHSAEQYAQFREHMPPGRQRRFSDIAFWTGHHTHDLHTIDCSMLDPDTDYVGADGAFITQGRYWRRNHKNPRVKNLWLPMEPEFRQIVIEMREEMGALWRPSTLVTEGRVWGMAKTLAAAADRAKVPRVSPIDLRRSFATMLTARGYPNEYVRHALGHEGEDSRTQGGESRRPSTASRHYLQFSPDHARKSMS